MDELYGDVGTGAGEPPASTTAAPAKQSLEHVYQKYEPASRQPQAPAGTGAAQKAPPQAAAREATGTDTGNLSVYVGNLQWWTTDAEVEAACGECGSVASMRFFEDKTNGKSKGYVLVTFSDSGGAKACVDKLNG